MKTRYIVVKVVQIFEVGNEDFPGPDRWAVWDSLSEASVNIYNNKAYAIAEARSLNEIVRQVNG